MKKILVLGGTVFVGRMVTERLLASGLYDVTLFNRGKSNGDLFKNVRQIHGDRETADIHKISEEHWDCVIDFSGYYPATFEKLLGRMEGKASRYIFISTISVFDIARYSGQVIDEHCATLACSEEQRISLLPEAYGEKKAEMERLLLRRDGLDKIIFRPSFIYGRYDWTERFYYWLYRAAQSDRILLPDGGSPHTLSLTNADDLTEAILLAIEIEKHSTIYNTVSTRSTTIRELLHTAATAYGKEPEIITGTMEQVEKHSASLPQFPLLLPFDFAVDDTLWLRDFPFTRAELVHTLLDMRDHKAAAGWPAPKAGMPMDQERELIEKMAR